jgi:hypothetical protein
LRENCSSPATFRPFSREKYYLQTCNLNSAKKERNITCIWLTGLSFYRIINFFLIEDFRNYSTDGLQSHSNECFSTQRAHILSKNHVVKIHINQIINHHKILRDQIKVSISICAIYCKFQSFRKWNKNQIKSAFALYKDGGKYRKVFLVRSTISCVSRMLIKRERV